MSKSSKNHHERQVRAYAPIIHPQPSTTTPRTSPHVCSHAYRPSPATVLSRLPALSLQAEIFIYRPDPLGQVRLPCIIGFGASKGIFRSLSCIPLRLLRLCFYLSLWFLCGSGFWCCIDENISVHKSRGLAAEMSE